MTLSVTPTPNGVVLTGCVDLTTVADFRLALLTAVDASEESVVVVDMSGLQFDEPTGLGAIIVAHHRATRLGRTLLLGSVPESLARLLEATRLSRVVALDPPAPVREPGAAQTAVDAESRSARGPQTPSST